MGGANGGGGGKYVPPGMRKNASASQRAGTVLDVNKPTASSFIASKGFKPGASGYYYPNATIRPHIHVYITTNGAADWSCLSMVALSSVQSGVDSGLTVKGTAALAPSEYNRTRVAQRLGLCSNELKQVWAEILQNL
jgi:hypothetical protein